MAKGDDCDPNGTLLTMLMVNATMLFLYPSTSQYILLLASFLIMQLVTVNGRYRVPYIVFAVGTTMFALSGNATILASVDGFSNLIQIDTVLTGID